MALVFRQKCKSNPSASHRPSGVKFLSLSCFSLFAVSNTGQTCFSCLSLAPIRPVDHSNAITPSIRIRICAFKIAEASAEFYQLTFRPLILGPIRWRKLDNVAHCVHHERRIVSSTSRAKFHEAVSSFSRLRVLAAFLIQDDGRNGRFREQLRRCKRSSPLDTCGL